MEANDILKKVRKIEIKTRVLSSNIFAGEYHSTFKGRGMSFAEVREYQSGDDTRTIDWNVTARFNRPFIKVFEEERELTSFLLIDVSASLNYGTRKQTEKDLVTEIAATLAFSAVQNNDKIGAIFFTDKIEKYLPPQKGRKQILHIIREILSFEPTSRNTDLSVALKFLMQIQARSSSVFLISDFIYRGDIRQTLQIIQKKHHLIAIQVYDKLLAEMPDVGILQVRDAETGRDLFIDTSNRKMRESHAKWWQIQQKQLRELFSSCRVDYASISTDGDYVKALMGLFAKYS